jgi:peroxiredoxin
MLFPRRALLVALTLLTPTMLYGQVSESTIAKDIKSLPSVADAQRPETTLKIATDLRTLPASASKVKLADNLARAATPGDVGDDALGAVATTLAQALSESPQPAKKDLPPEPYMELAKLAHYRAAKVTLNDPLYAKAGEILAAEDADVQKADFTLKDLHGKKVTLSELKGKIVLVNFWATGCKPCMKEMPNLDVIYTHFESQGLVILSLSEDDSFKLNTFVSHTGYHPTVLLDFAGKIAKEFHVEGLPRDFVFDRTGKLVAESIDEVSQPQMLAMLANAGLHP